MLQKSTSAVSQDSIQVEDLQSTRPQAARGIAAQGTVYDEGIVCDVPPVSDAQENFVSGSCVDPVASGSKYSFSSNSLSVSAPDILQLQSGGSVHYNLGIGVSKDAMYDDVNLKDVACTNFKNF